MPKMVTLSIDGQEVSVPEGTLIVNAASQIGIDIPVFCYHPKMEPVGMCRMCLVEVGRPVTDRATGQVQLDANGSPKLQFGPKLETACTTPVSPGMVVIQKSDKVKAARKDVVEFILTSHPLDCPVCDKGGECSLQNLTMAFGSGQSRFLFDEKMHLDKHLPLGELIFLDRERCIQCGRCVRFQTDISNDPVIAFYQRGRSLEIITCSEPGFNSFFSGNTTDICPVGALTTADFRFGARPWELNASASICPHCPVGCNITFNTRREARTRGQKVIKRVMPRQNEAVNEIWLCDKGRFGYHYVESDQRLTQPLMRKNGELVPTSWEIALDLITTQLKSAGTSLVSLAGGRLSNEDLFNLKQLTTHQGGQALLYGQMGGGELTTQIGLVTGSNLSSLGKGSTILVVASDLEEEAPIWSLRLLGAARHGAKLIVANPRPTKLENEATFRVRYTYGQETSLVDKIIQECNAISPESPVNDDTKPTETVSPSKDALIPTLARAISTSENLVIFFGSEGLGLEGSQSLAQACAKLLESTGHYGKPNNGLVGVWSNPNTQGASDVGFQPAVDLADKLTQAKLTIVAAADPAGDDPVLAMALDPKCFAHRPDRSPGFLVVQELFMTKTAQLADIVLPAQAFAEHEGTYTSGERRVQRFYPTIPSLPGTQADFSIFAKLSAPLGLELEGNAPISVFRQLSAQVPGYADLTYQSLSESSPQWPNIDHKYFSLWGTSYDNPQGLGVQLPPGTSANRPANLSAETSTIPGISSPNILIAVPITCLYDRGQTLLPSIIMNKRLAPCQIRLNPTDAIQIGFSQDATVQVKLDGTFYSALLKLDETVPAGVALVPRSVGLPISRPVVIEILAEDTGILP